LSSQKNTTSCRVGNPDPGFGQATKCGRVILVNGISVASI